MRYTLTGATVPLTRPPQRCATLPGLPGHGRLHADSAISLKSGCSVKPPKHWRRCSPMYCTALLLPLGGGVALACALPAGTLRLAACKLDAFSARRRHRSTLLARSPAGMSAVSSSGNALEVPVLPAKQPT
jgi:hypothetical protein